MKTSSLKNLYVSDPVIGGGNSTSEGRHPPARLNTSPQFTSNSMESNPVCHEVQLSSSTATLNIPQGEKNTTCFSFQNFGQISYFK